MDSRFYGVLHRNIRMDSLIATDQRGGVMVLAGLQIPTDREIMKQNLNGFVRLLKHCKGDRATVQILKQRSQVQITKVTSDIVHIEDSKVQLQRVHKTGNARSVLEVHAIIRNTKSNNTVWLDEVAAMEAYSRSRAVKVDHGQELNDNVPNGSFTSRKQNGVVNIINLPCYMSPFQGYLTMHSHPSTFPKDPSMSSECGRFYTYRKRSHNKGS
ncbi:hypothetical protein CTI12_AA375000 [Artemisia annua]|uniref:Uncharacterized protein n=1 Tax=Artemisia annua TaxID=35608 RepID=A0A2U1MIX1_ARTAN|nr:hypothetical protein CTI12_AA375000 [Artemisia annua]